jgi:hypothetical protein
MERRGRRRKQLLNDLKEEKRYGKLKDEALSRTLWRTCFEKAYEPVKLRDNGVNLATGRKTAHRDLETLRNHVIVALRRLQARQDNTAGYKPKTS